MCQLPWAEVLRRVCFSSSPGLMVQIGLFSWMYSEMEMVMSLLIFGQQSQAMYFFVCLWVYSVYEKECMRRATRHDALDLITMFRWWFCSLKLCSMMHQGRALDQGLCLRGQEYTTCLCWEGVGSSVSCQRRSSSFLAEKCVPSARPHPVCLQVFEAPLQEGSNWYEVHVADAPDFFVLHPSDSLGLSENRVYAMQYTAYTCIYPQW